MASAAQIAANRANAARSTGPRTARGKQRSSRNSLKHGAYARKHGAFAIRLLSDENQAGFVALRESYVNLYQPATQTQYFLVARLALAAWRLQRLASLEARVVSAHQDAALRDSDLIQSIAALRALFPNCPEPQSTPIVPRDEDPVARAYIRDSERGNTLAKLVRLQNSLERSYYLALHELESRVAKESSDAAGPLPRARPAAPRATVF